MRESKFRLIERDESLHFSGVEYFMALILRFFADRIAFLFDCNLSFEALLQTIKVFAVCLDGFQA